MAQPSSADKTKKKPGGSEWVDQVVSSVSAIADEPQDEASVDTTIDALMHKLPMSALTISQDAWAKIAEVKSKNIQLSQQRDLYKGFLATICKLYIKCREDYSHQAKVNDDLKRDICLLTAQTPTELFAPKEAREATTVAPSEDAPKPERSWQADGHGFRPPGVWTTATDAPNLDKTWPSSGSSLPWSGNGLTEQALPSGSPLVDVRPGTCGSSVMSRASCCGSAESSWVSAHNSSCGESNAPGQADPTREQRSVCTSDRILPTLRPHITTLGVRNIPARFGRDELLQDWPCDGTYDFLYVPYNCAQNRPSGVCFINFVSHEHAVAFQDRWHGRFLLDHGRSKHLDIVEAHLQGKQANMDRIRLKKVDGGNEKHLPAVFKDGVRVDVYEDLVTKQSHGKAAADMSELHKRVHLHQRKGPRPERPGEASTARGSQPAR